MPVLQIYVTLSVSAFIVYTLESTPFVSFTYTFIVYVVPLLNPVNVLALLVLLEYAPLFIE